MAPSLPLECIGDISILLIESDTTSVSSLISMIEPFSKKVMSVEGASEAISMIEKQKKEIGLIIANIEMPNIDSQSFLSSLLHKDIPLILINPEAKTNEPSDLLTKRSCFSLDKPISEEAIKNMWQHVFPKMSQTNITQNQENVSDSDKARLQIQAFRANLKKHKIGQASLLGKRPFMTAYRTSQASLKRKGLFIENKRNEVKKVDKHVGRRKTLWTDEKHMNFLAAISILGENECRPKSILSIMNDSNLTKGQVSSHLQRYKDGLLNDTTPINGYSSEYPFKASNLRKKNSSSSSSSIPQLSFEKTIAKGKKNNSEFHQNNDSVVGNVNNVPSTTSNNPPCNDNANHTSLVSTGLGNENIAMDVNPMDIFDFPPLPEEPLVPLEDIWSTFLPNTAMNTFETNTDQMDGVSTMVENGHLGVNMDGASTENNVFPTIDQLDWDSLGQGYDPSGGIVDFGGSILPQVEANTDPTGFVSGEIPPNTTNVTNLETNTGVMNHVPYDDGGLDDIPIEDLISFDDFDGSNSVLN